MSRLRFSALARKTRFMGGVCVALASTLPLTALAQSFVVYGLEFGVPLNLPECPKVAVGISAMYGYSSSPCLRAAVPRKGPSDFSEGGLIAFPYGLGPKHSARALVGFSILDGNLATIVISTAGAAVQDAVLEDLIVKFGRPSSNSTVPFQNAMGASYNGIVATWDLGTHQVEFLGLTTNVTSGQLIIGTAVGLKARQDRLNLLLKPSGRPL